MPQSQSAIAHDLGNLLAIIVSNCELAMLQVAVFPVARLDNIAKAAARANELVKLLRTDAQGSALENSTDLNALVSELRHLVPESVELRIEPDQMAVAPGSALDYFRILLNVVDNAVKAGATLITVKTLSIPGERGTVMVAIADDGCGLPAAISAALNSSARAATRGLSIVQDCLQKLAGEVNVQSVPGKGTTFTFSFPAA